MNEALGVIKNDMLTFEQKVLGLAQIAENTLDVLNIEKETEKYREQGIICDLFEGNAPYRPRYVVPDYEKFMKNGSEFLDLQPAEDLYDAINNLEILYRHVPSITTFPVYVGNLDYLLEPYMAGIDEKDAYKAIKRFLKYIDRTITDSFCHGNIGPKKTKAGMMILKAQQELQTSIPNLTVKYNADMDKEFVDACIVTAMKTAKPSFANDAMFQSDFDGDYGIVSCYNGLHLGGGSYTLVRVNFGRVVDICHTETDLFQRVLPDVIDRMLTYMDQRIAFLVEESGFFESNFLSKEGLISKEKFSAMFGLVGIANIVNHVLGLEKQEERYGHGEAANALGLKIVKFINERVAKHENKHTTPNNGRYMLHAQVGIDSDIGIAPGCRIPIGEEPEVFEHMVHSGAFHEYFPSGIGDILTFDETYLKNTDAIRDIVDGAFDQKVRYLSFYGENSDVIRITGYLVKRSEIEKMQQGKQVLRDTVVLGKGAVENQKVLERKVRK